MSNAVHSFVDTEAFDAFKRGDERGLEAIFSASYPSLIDDAATRLTGDGIAAARAVENAFVQAWRARDSIENASALEDGLRVSLRDEAARMLSRAEAAHRLDQMEGGHTSRFPVRRAPGVVEAWQSVQAILHVDPRQLATEVHRAGVESLHHASAQLSEMEKPEFTWRRMLVVAAVLAGIGGAAYFLLQESESEMLTKALTAPGLRVATTAAGEMNVVRLPDGSLARLGPASTLRIPAKFGTTMRGVDLSGTAEFTVATADGPRFNVRVGAALITATGTQFVARHFPDEQTAMVLVQQGTVTVTAGDSVRTLGAGDASEVTDGNVFLAPSALSVEAMVGWHDSSLVFAKQTLAEMLVQMERWFAVKLVVRDTALLTREVTMRVAVGDYNAAIAALQQSAGVKKVWVGEDMVLLDARR
jgi:ferric-dicitrate binding protein FerR (iron transport regulator)